MDQVIALFRELADRPPAEREEYYASHHVAEAVRAEVESLVRFDSQTHDSLRANVASAARRLLHETDPLQLRQIAARLAPALVRAYAPPMEGAPPWPERATADEPGSWFGAYRLRHPLGAGGMGVTATVRPFARGRPLWRHRSRRVLARARGGGCAVA
jgi:hypothetical protein